MTKDEALKLAMDWYGSGNQDPDEFEKLILSIVAQPDQEPVAWRYRSVSPFVGKDGTYKVSDGWTLIRKPEKRDAHSAMCGMEAEPLYTTPPQRTWVGLTDEERREAWLSREAQTPTTFAKDIEQALKEKNT